MCTESKFRTLNMKIFNWIFTWKAKYTIGFQRQYLQWKICGNGRWSFWQNGGLDWAKEIRPNGLAKLTKLPCTDGWGMHKVICVDMHCRKKENLFPAAGDRHRHYWWQKIPILDFRHWSFGIVTLFIRTYNNYENILDYAVATLFDTQI